MIPHSDSGPYVFSSFVECSQLVCCELLQSPMCGAQWLLSMIDQISSGCDCGCLCIYNFIMGMHFWFNPRELFTPLHCYLPVYTGASCKHILLSWNIWHCQGSICNIMSLGTLTIVILYLTNLLRLFSFFFVV